MTTKKRPAAGRPRRGKSVRATISLRLDPALLKRIDRDAKLRGESRTEWLEQAAEGRLTGDRTGDPP
jgi:hypothetical protein